MVPRYKLKNTDQDSVPFDNNSHPQMMNDHIH